MKWISISFLALAAGSAGAQTPPAITGSMEASASSARPPGRSEAKAPHDFGVGTQQSATIPAAAMVPLVSDMTYGYGSGLYRYRTGGSLYFEGGVSIPTGGLITRMHLDACDTNSGAEVAAFLYKCQGVACDTLASIHTGSPGTPGCTLFSAVVDPVETVNQLSYDYIVEVAMTGTDATTSFRDVRVFWERQLSPAPPTATFGDVPTSHPFFRVIEALAASGITSGCGGGNFCPDGVVTRKEMAKFLARALGLFYSDSFTF
ncbi:MAG TPA: S-layer homology domain-containing protein [Thermoanaerobaculia bacterium]|jgi:hypothetical protein